MKSSAPTKYAALAGVSSLPWCCIVPAILSLLSVSSAASARLIFQEANGLLLVLSLLFLGRAFWLNFVRRQGAPWTRWVTVTSAIAVAALWSYRLAWFIG